MTFKVKEFATTLTLSSKLQCIEEYKNEASFDVHSAIRQFLNTLKVRTDFETKTYKNVEL